MGHCPHLPGGLSCLALLRDPQCKANSSGEVHGLPQTMVMSFRSWRWELGDGRPISGVGCGRPPGSPQPPGFPTGSPDEQVSQEGELTVGHVLHCKTRRQTLSVGSAPCSALGQH